MEDNKLEIFFKRNVDILDLYKLTFDIDSITESKIISLDIYSYTYLNKDIRNYLHTKEYNILIIYLAEDIYPCISIDINFFITEFKPIFNIVSRFNYYLVDESIPIFRLIEYNSKGVETGNFIDL